ncbi:MAG: exodeoxyribonuclease VII small subunit [Chitinispirillales bacterium]|jgi:exodeoxyribonuclease VII small subunit|nr:exodeoxyribonuclease VII small subunit [Chitinispirillales bacterium]
MAAAKKKKTPNTLTFEEALSTLEEVIKRLERDDGLTLEQSLSHFEEGIALMRHCDGHLKNARGRLIELTKGKDGKFITEVLGEGLALFAAVGDDHNNKGDTDDG